MSSKARRITDASAVTSFDWGRPRQPIVDRPGVAAAHVEPPPADVAQQQAHFAALERDAFAKGFAQGERAGAEAAGKRGEAMLRRMTQTLEELTTLRAQMIRQTEQQMVQLALAVARRIVRREVSLDQDLLIAMARVALDRLGDSAQVTVHLHPEEYEATVAAQSAQFNGTNVTVVPDARVGRGGCRVESQFGMIDAGIDAQIQELARALLGEEQVAVPNANHS